MSLKRKSHRRSSILKGPRLLDEVQNYSYDERSMRKRVSFANTLYVREFDPPKATQLPAEVPQATVGDENSASDNILISTPTGKRRRTSVLSDLKSQRLSIIPKLDSTFTLTEDEVDEHFVPEESPMITEEPQVSKAHHLSHNPNNTHTLVDSPVENTTNAQAISMDLTEFSPEEPRLSNSLLSPGAFLDGAAVRSAPVSMSEDLDLTCDVTCEVTTDIAKANQTILEDPEDISLNLNEDTSVSPDGSPSMDLTNVKECSHVEAEVDIKPTLKDNNSSEVVSLCLIDAAEQSKVKNEPKDFTALNMSSNWMDGTCSMPEGDDSLGLPDIPALRSPTHVTSPALHVASPGLRVASPARATSKLATVTHSAPCDVVHKLKQKAVLDPLDITISTPEAVPIPPNDSSSGNLNTTFQPDSILHDKADLTTASPSAYSKFCAFVNCNQTITQSAQSSFSGSRSEESLGNSSFCFSHYLVQLHTEVQQLRKALKQRLNNTKYTSSHEAVPPSLRILHNAVSQSLSAIELLKSYAEVSGESGLSGSGQSLDFSEVLSNEDITGCLSAKVKWFAKMHQVLLDVVCPTVEEAMLCGQEVFGWTLVSWDKEIVELALPDDHKVSLQLSIPNGISVASAPVRVLSVRIQSQASKSNDSSSWKTPLIRCSNMSELPKAILQAKELLLQQQV